MGAFKRTGLHRLDCSGCANTAYSTIAKLERFGLPVCPCGARFEPGTIDLATALGRDDVLVFDALSRLTDDKERAQLWRLGQRGVESKVRAGTLNSMPAAAYDEILSAQRAEGRKRRLSALLPTPEPMPF